MITEAQRKVLRYLRDNPGSSVMAYYDSKRTRARGIERVSQRGAAGRMRWRLSDAGWIEVVDTGRFGGKEHDRITPNGLLAVGSESEAQNGE